DGEFFKVFARLHPTKDFPYVSVLFLGGVAFVFSMLFKLSETISAILAMRIMIQFIGQAIGLLILRSRKSETEFPYKMPLFPLPVIIAIAMWLFILISTGTKLMFSGMFVIFLGVIVYFIKAKFQKEWPFATSGKQ
ncbi:MAG: amino acid permease, partial [Ginsengibacter sp.]